MCRYHCRLDDSTGYSGENGQRSVSICIVLYDIFFVPTVSGNHVRSFHGQCSAEYGDCFALYGDSEIQRGISHKTCRDMSHLVLLTVISVHNGIILHSM